MAGRIRSSTGWMEIGNASVRSSTGWMGVSALSVRSSTGWLQFFASGPVVLQPGITETSTTGRWRAKGTYKAGTDCESVTEEYREWDENGTEVSTGWTTVLRSPEDTTPGSTVLEETADVIGDQCHEIQFRFTGWTGDNATGSAGSPVSTTRERLDRDNLGDPVPC